MIVFETELNGIRLNRSGAQGDGLLGINIGLHLDENADQGQVCTGSFLTVGGLFDGTHLRWTNLRDRPVIGDVVTIRVLSADDSDTSESRERAEDPAIARRSRYTCYLAYRREFEADDLRSESPGDVDPEVARAVRRRLYRELREEFDRESDTPHSAT